MMTDPIADLLTRVRNAYAIGRREVVIPFSKLKFAICQTLKREGFIDGVDEVEGAPRNRLKVELRYTEQGSPAMLHIQRVSTPGCREYRGVDEIKPVAGGVGVAVLTTSRGVLSDREARAQKVGGEVLCEVW